MPKIDSNALRRGLIFGIVAVFIGTIGALVAFSEREVIKGIFTLADLALLAIFLGAGYAATARPDAPERTPGDLALNGLAAGAVVGGLLSIFTLIAQAVNLRPVFTNLSPQLLEFLMMGQEGLDGLVLLFLSAAMTASVGALMHRVSERALRAALTAFGVVVVLGLLQTRVRNIIGLIDAMTLVVSVIAGYVFVEIKFGARLLHRLQRDAEGWSNRKALAPALLDGVAGGMAFGLLIFLVLFLVGWFGVESWLAMLGSAAPDIPKAIFAQPDTLSMGILLIVIHGVLGGLGGLAVRMPKGVHNMTIALGVTVLVLGLMNTIGQLTLFPAITVMMLVAGAQMIAGLSSAQSETLYERLSPRGQQSVRGLVVAASAILLIIVPQVFDQYITSIIDLVGVYILMGLALNIVVGYAGLLDLGHVAFFAIGAYTMGLATTPNLITCGGDVPASADAIAETCRTLTFWSAWPLSMITAGLAGLLIGLPVLRMRGDYLAIVTLGFGEIIRLVALSDQFKPWLGAAMGVTGIPSPTIDLRGLAEAIPILEGLGGPFVREIEMFSANEMYYLVLGAVALVAIVAYRLSQSRQGRAWMAMRADEDVAEAMGINLVKNKLLAFWIGASFSGIGGAVFAAWWHSIFPGSFNLQVSINVLSLIIIGGLGSFSGVVIGAFVLIGLPEVLREFEEFRQLVFGALLVIMMLVRPEGLIPRQPPELEEEAEELAGERPPTLKTNEEAAS